MRLLADQMRPKKLSEVIGQDHLIGDGKILTNLVKNKKIFSIILHGKPGIGKTSIAEAITTELSVNVRKLNAVINKKTDFDIVIEESKMLGDIVLVIDEIHRMNKDKQDILLPYIESGRIIIIGLTTSNPYHSINPAIRSRCQIFKLNELTEEDIISGLERAREYLDDIKVDKETLRFIAGLSSGDLRNALNLLEIAYYSTDNKNVTIDIIKTINSKPVIHLDKNDSNYYDIISAMQKSIRGSDVNASLYYLGLLLEAEDLDIIKRRLIVIAYEDIGLANPSIGPKVMAAVAAVDQLGMPEARIPLASIVIEMALSPKSNSAISAIDSALNIIRKGSSGVVPEHIKTNSKDYKYPHNYKNYWVLQQYLPNDIKDEKFYFPKDNKFEKGLEKYNEEIKK